MRFIHYFEPIEDSFKLLKESFKCFEGSSFRPIRSFKDLEHASLAAGKAMEALRGRPEPGVRRKETKIDSIKSLKERWDKLFFLSPPPMEPGKGLGDPPVFLILVHSRMGEAKMPRRKEKFISIVIFDTLHSVDSLWGIGSGCKCW